VLLLASLAAPGLWAQDSPSGAAPAKIPSFDVKAMDTTADPCVDFYQYACGGWMKAHPLPPDRAVWGRFNEVADRNQEILRQILEKAEDTSKPRTPDEQKIGDFYAACMDEAAIEAKGTKPIEAELQKIDAATSKAALLGAIVSLQRMGANVLFRFSPSPDAKNSMQMIGEVTQGGLGLPDRDYYLSDNPRQASIRRAYETHVEKMLALAGEPPEKAAAGAKAVMAIETELAKAALDRVSRRDPNKTYHKMTLDDLEKLCPAIPWRKFFQEDGAPPMRSLNVSEPEFFRGLQSVLTNNSLDDLKTYLRWQYVNASADLLPDKFVQEDFHFYGQTLTGAKQILPRWKRCTSYTDRTMGDALGKEFVKAAFPPEAKKRTLELVHQIEAAMRTDLQNVDWMTPETKKQALIKLDAVANKIGYPDHWKNYSTLKIVRGDALGNQTRARKYWIQDRLAKIGKPVDRTEWGMTPPTVNAYYSPEENNINFPAGILQPPFYDNNADDAVNYGGIGVVIGHELTHGFDDEGRQFDASGNLRDWWTPEDAKEFLKRAQCFVDEYSSFEPAPGTHLNGKLTLGENSADNGGLRLAFMALMKTLNGHEPPKIDGFTAEQRFFLSYGQIWCQNLTEQAARLQANTNPHSTGKFRVDGAVSNDPDFQKAFACHVGQPMVRNPACRVW
jgi:putative endopeptidase